MPPSLPRNFLSRRWHPWTRLSCSKGLDLGSYRDAHRDPRAAGPACATHIFDSPGCGGDRYSKHADLLYALQNTNRSHSG